MTYKTLLLSHFNRGSNLNLGVALTKKIVFSLSHVVTITNFSIQDGHTALRTASFNGHHKVVELLLGGGANPDLQDKVKRGWDSGVHSDLSNFNDTSCIL